MVISDMRIRHIIAFLIIGLAVYLAASQWVQTAGYMDAEYYLTNAQRLVDGDGLTEPYLWNYLDDPDELPHPSHLYWMPMTTFLTAASMKLLGGGFKFAQLPGILMAAVLPTLTVLIALRLHGNRRWAWTAGILALIPGFYLPYLVTTDTFALYALVGGVALWVMSEATQRRNRWLWLITGLLIGLANLSRADGLLLLAPAVLAVAWTKHRMGRSLLLLTLGYLICMAPWWARNIMVQGSAYQPGAARTLWLLSYDELFSYPAKLLSPIRWWNSGLMAIVGARLGALWTNLQRLLAENGLIFLAPFMFIGARRFKVQPLVRLVGIYLILLIGVMSFIFPFAGANGGFFHSSAALMPVLWVLAPVGIDRAVRWGAERRHWDQEQATRVFSTSAVVIAGFLTTLLFWNKVVGDHPQEPRWEAGLRTYQEVGNVLKIYDLAPGVVAVNNPPGFFLATGLQAVVIPNGAQETLRMVIERYGVRWVVLDANRPMGLAALYEGRVEVPWLETSTALEDDDGRPIQLFKVLPQEVQP